MCFNSDVGDTLGSGLPPGSCKQTQETWERERERVTQEIQKQGGVQVYSVPVCAQHGMGCLDTAPRIPHVLSPLLPPPMVSRLMVKVVPEPRARYQPEFEGYSPTRRARRAADGYMLQPGRAVAFTRYFNNSFMISFHSAWQNCSQNSCEEKLRHG